MSNAYPITAIGTLTSNAHGPNDIEKIFQRLLQQILGLDPLTDQFADAAVRVAWQQNGQPAWLISEDVTILRATPRSDNYTAVRELGILASLTPTNFQQNQWYSRVWDVRFTLYGPNAFLRAGLIKSCTFMDFAHDTLAQSNLYLIPEESEPKRTKERFVKQWWEMSIWQLSLYEFVTESIEIPKMASVEVIIETKDGVVSDETIDFAGFGSGSGYGSGGYGL